MEGIVIYRMETPEDLSEIFEDLPAEWVQFLTENCTNPRCYIIAEIDSELVGYVVALNSVMLPMSDYFTIILDGGDPHAAIEGLKAEAKKCGAIKIVRAAYAFTPELEEEGWEQESIQLQMVL